MMTEHLKIKVNPEVFKLNHPMVNKLRTAGMSLEAFTLLIRPEDPYILIGDTIYAYTEQEFYAIRAVMPLNDVSDAAFAYVLGISDMSFMSEDDRSFIMNIRDNVQTCSACRYRRYRDEVARLVKKYNIDIPEDKKAKLDSMPGEYPETTDRVVPVVFAMLDHMYAVPKMKRRSCMDCVEKHLAQAWVLSKECLQGYPEHISYVIGHLGEAIDELPKEMLQLKQTLEFCLAKTNYMRSPFVPLGAISGHIDMGRIDKTETSSDDNPAENTKFELDFTDAMKDEIMNMPDPVRSMLGKRLATIKSDFTPEVRNHDRREWIGMMATAADSIADVAPRTANMLRARRIVFSGAPELMEKSGYGLHEILSAIPDFQM